MWEVVWLIPTPLQYVVELLAQPAIFAVAACVAHFRLLCRAVDWVGACVLDEG